MNTRKSFFVAVMMIAGMLATYASAQIGGGNDRSKDSEVNQYPREVLEEYWQCMERYDLEGIQKLLWQHHNVEKIDASIYGLPVSDFDDRSLMTIDERLQYREGRAERFARLRDDVAMATSGSVQYPHHLREALDHFYEVNGDRPDCSKILGEGGSFSEPRAMGSSWGTDLNLTSFDGSDRGEVDIVIDYANPNRIMASSCPSGGSPDSSSNLIMYSDDWGQTWGQTAVGNNSGNTWECDPVSYYQRSTGNVYHSKIGCTSGTCGTTQLMMRYSTNNGANWSDCGRPDNLSSEDRQWHVVDNTPSSPGYGNIYITWHNSNVEKVVRSTDDCSSWGAVTDLATSSITPDINVAADGHVYVVFQRHGDATFKIAGSSDQGASWNAPATKTIKNRLGDWKNNIPAQCERGISTMPNVDVDRCSWSQYYGRVYMTMFDFDQSGCASKFNSCSNAESNWNDSCDYDIWFTYSDNQGATWAPIVNVTRDVLGHGDKVDSFMGYMRVDESDGSIYIGYHRTRLNPTQLSDREKTHYFVARSIDGGTNWTEFQLSSLEGDEKVSGASTFERGDYNHIDVIEGVIYPVWIDRRNSNGEEEVVTRKLCTEPAHQVERAPTFAAPLTTLTNAGGGTVNISWAAPDAHWGDGGEDNVQRKYQLWVDGSLAQDNINWTTTSITGYDPGDCNSHSYFIRAFNQCGITKDYQTNNFSATGCCTGNPTTVNVTPDGPLTLCLGTSQTLSISLTGGTAPFTYQWTRDGSNISGATSSSYSANDSGTHTYNCVVIGSGCASGVSDVANTQITWQSEPTFSGITSATNASVSNPCTIDLEWNQASSVCPGPITYRIYRENASPVTIDGAHQIATGLSCGSSPCTYSDIDTLTSGTEYFYVVHAYDASTTTEDSNAVEDSAIPNGPGGGNQVLLDDDFETALDWSNWTVTTGPGAHSCGDWARTNSATQIPSAGSGYYALSDSDACNSGSTTSTILTSQVIDCSSITSNVILAYDIYYNYYDGDDATVEVYDGSSWQVVWADNNVDINTSHSWDVTAHAVGNANFQIRFNYQNAAWDYWFAVDDILLTGDVANPCTTGGGCTNPGAPSITSITDDDNCAQSGVTINFSSGSGAASHDLWDDGVQVVVGFTAGSSYDPGDSLSHSYVIRAIDSTCFTDSTGLGFTDDDSSAATPGAPAVSDIDACALTGIEITWAAAAGATSYDLQIDGSTTITNVTSPYTYSPGESSSHSFTVRGVNATCGVGTFSGATSGSDVNGLATPAAPSVIDVSACATSGVQISWSNVAGASFHDILVDGSTTLAGVTSPHLYIPGDNGSHSYQVRGRSASCTGNYSTSTPGTDYNFSFTSPGIETATDRDECDDSGVVVVWNIPSSWGDGGAGTRTFTVLRNGGDISGALAEAATSFVDTTGTNGVNYTYSVRATNGYGCEHDGGTTDTAADTVGTGPVFAGLQTVSGLPGGVCGLRLEWNATTSNCGSGPGIVYNVYRSLSSGFTPDGATLMTSCIADLYYEDMSAAGGTTYYYIVQAEDSSAGHGGPCNDGFVDGNNNEVSGSAGGGFTTLYSENFDGFSAGDSADWAHGTFAGSDFWVDVRACTANSSPNVYRYGQTSCSASYGSDSDALAYPQPGGSPISVPAGATGVSLGFAHDWDFASGDGASLWLASATTYPTFSYIGATYLTGQGYTGTANGNDSFTGSSGSFASTQVDLSQFCTDNASFGADCAGEDLYFAFEAFSDVMGVLYDQAVSPSTSGKSCQDFEAAYDIYDAEGAADFIVPAGGWVVERVDIPGSYSASGLLGSVDVLVYTDNSGTPGVVACSNMGVGGANLVDTSGDLEATLPTPCDLSAGTYWLGIQGNMDYGTGGQWYWTLDLVQSTGYEGVWRNPGDGFGTGCTAWTYLTTCDATSDPDYLFTLHGHAAATGWNLDDVELTYGSGAACSTAPSPVQHFTARSTNGAVKLEWENPSAPYASTRICVDPTAFPTDPATCSVLVDLVGTAGAYGSYSYSGLTNTSTYYYTAFVDNGSGEYSARQTVAARPFDNSGKIKWCYHSSASALAPTGMWPGAIGSGAGYAVSNDRVLHGLNPTDAGGDWPRTGSYSWTPMVMNGPAQARPPVLATNVVPGAARVLFLGSEDGHAYAANAETGVTMWQSPLLANLLLASPTGILTQYGAAFDLLFIGSRDASSANEMSALNPADGTVAWSFDNGGGGNAIGIISSTGWADAATNRLYFTSREASAGSKSTMWCLSFNGSSASVLWQRALGDIDGRARLYDSVIYVGNNSGKVFALDAATGATLWSYATGDGSVKSVVTVEMKATPRKVFFSTRDTVWALDDNGASVSLGWQEASIGAPSAPLYAQAFAAVFVGSSDGGLYQLDPATGAVVTSITIGDGSATVGAPALDLSNSMTYLGTESGGVYGVELPLQ